MPKKQREIERDGVFPDENKRSRFAVLRIYANRPAYVVYDKLHHAIVDGVYFVLEDSLNVAAWLSNGGEIDKSLEYTSPSDEGLGLIFPSDERRQRKENLHV